MTTHRSSKAVSNPALPVERAVTVALLLALFAGLAWIGGMLFTAMGWPF